ncbi:protein ALTERED XYLOGLUCAN [Trifolium repens]|nr:protein ALTERED XYLOGLUCAN [Trifolium repens]
MKDKSIFFNMRVLPLTICSLLSISLLLIYFYNLPFSPSSKNEFTHSKPIINITSHSSLSVSPTLSSYSGKKKTYQNQCDYSKGDWIKDTKGPLYNDTTCNLMKEGRNCIKHGRPDSDYLYWRWKPNECYLPRFEPKTFLQLINNKHIAFVGDSMARNQLESLLCMLSTSSIPKLVYQNSIGKDNQFSRWYFSKYNVTISLYWSPFLVQGIEKSNNRPNNELYLDHVDEKWAKDMDQMDMIVLSIGHWFLLQAIYHEGDSILGCHYCGLNYTDVGFYDVLRKCLRTTLNSIIDRRGHKGNNGIDVVVTTFTPHHFEGEWDKAGACPKTKPYSHEEKKVEGMDNDMRKVEIEEVKNAKNKGNEFGRFRFEVLDITNLALLRPDGHPGPYMNPFPFYNGVQEHVQNDCVHWCLPGPIDTWNEIFLEMIKKWEEQPRSEK